VGRRGGTAGPARGRRAAAGRRFAAAGDRERDAWAAAIEVRALIACAELKSAGARLRSLARVPARRRSPRLRHLALAAGAALARARGERSTARRLLQRAADEAERLAARLLRQGGRAAVRGRAGRAHPHPA